MHVLDFQDAGRKFKDVNSSRVAVMKTAVGVVAGIDFHTIQLAEDGAIRYIAQKI
jgi:hypothetical protein